MNLSQCKDPVSHMCSAGTVEAFWYLRQEVVGLNLFTVVTKILSLNSVKHLVQTQISGKTFAENCMKMKEIFPFDLFRFASC